MIKFDSLRVGLAMAASALVASCASFADPLTETLQPLGAWASGTDGDACETAPITYFSSDGVVLVLLSAKGPVHAIGSWDRNGDGTVTRKEFLKALIELGLEVEKEVILSIFDKWDKDGTGDG